MLQDEKDQLNSRLRDIESGKFNAVKPIVSSSGKTLSSVTTISDTAANASPNLVVMQNQGDAITSNIANQYIGSYDVNNNDSINGLNITLFLPFSTRSY